MSRAVGFWIALLLIFAGTMCVWLARKQLADHKSGSVSVADKKSAVVDQPPLTEFELLDQRGLRMNSQELDGQVWAGSFFFASCPSICYQLNIKLQQLMAVYGERGLHLVSITCDPARDTPAALAQYATRFNADPGKWRFLTSADADLDYLKRIGQDIFELAVAEETHSDRVVIFDRDGKVRGAYSLTKPEQLLELQKLLDTLLPAPVTTSS